MTGTTTSVNRARRYDASRRREQARQTQARIVSIATQRFLADGYATTSVAGIAQAAGVSVDTIYKAFGGKPGLARAIMERAIEGEGPIPAEQRSDRLQEEESDPGKIIAGWGRFVAELTPRGAPIALMLRDAVASAPELRQVIDEIDAARLRRMMENAKRLRRAGHLRAGVTVAAAADVMWAYTSAELYELLVIRRGMPIERYGRFVAEAMAAALL